LKLDLSEIARTPGAYVEHAIDEFILEKGGDIGAYYPINGKLIFQSTGQVLVITGNFRTKIDDICDRCGESAIADIKAVVAEDFIVHPFQHQTKGKNEQVMPLVEEDEDAVESHLFYKGTFDLNLDELLRQNIVLNTPLKIICDDNCNGLCVRCGKKLKEDDVCDCNSTELNPQFAALKDFFK